MACLNAQLHHRIGISLFRIGQITSVAGSLGERGWLLKCTSLLPSAIGISLFRIGQITSVAGSLGERGWLLKCTSLLPSAIGISLFQPFASELAGF